MRASNTTYRVGPEGDSPPTAGAELGLAVRTQVPTAVRKLGLVADSAGGSVVAVSRRGRGRGLPDHRLPVAGQLVLDTSGWRRHTTAQNGRHVFVRKGARVGLTEGLTAWNDGGNMEEVLRNQEDRRREKGAVFMVVGPLKDSHCTAQPLIIQREPTQSRAIHKILVRAVGLVHN